MSGETFYSFETKNFRIDAIAEDDYDLGLSWDDDGPVRADLEAGRLVSFGVICRVTFKPTGEVVGEDSLWGCVYNGLDEFATGHRDANPLNRNSSVMRAARGDVTICHYFPSLITEALHSARGAILRRREAYTALRLRNAA